MINKEEKSARISDILEQIEDLNTLILTLKKHDADTSTLEQYFYIRNQFTSELSLLMAEFSFKIEPAYAA